MRAVATSVISSAIEAIIAGSYTCTGGRRPSGGRVVHRLDNTSLTDRSGSISLLSPLVVGDENALEAPGS